MKKADALASKRRDCLAGYQFGSVQMERNLTLGMFKRFNKKYKLVKILLFFLKLTHMICETKLLYPEQWQLAPPAMYKSILR